MHKKQTRVLQVGKYYAPSKGGIETVTQEIMQGLNAAETFTCDLLCFSEDTKSHKIKRDGGTVYKTASLCKLNSMSISPLYLLQFFRLHKKYDILHLHHPNPMAFLALFLFRPKARIVMQWHSDIIKQKRLLKLLKPLQDFALGYADVIVATSQNYATHSEQLREHMSKVKIVPLGIEPLPKVKPSDKYKNRKLIFAIGRLVSYKGFKYLIESARFLDDSYLILIAGEGELKESLQNEIKRYHLQTKVELLGGITQEQKYTLLTSCDIFCLPSITKAEAFGVVMLEAMSYAKPIVSTNLQDSGISWVNEDGVSGLYVAPKSPKGLAEAFEKIMNDEKLYVIMAKNAKQRFYKCFTVEKMIEKLLKIEGYSL